MAYLLNPPKYGKSDRVEGIRPIDPLGAYSVIKIHDPRFEGIGFIVGQITEQNRPVGGAIVQCVHSETNLVVKATNSEVDGTFVFQNLDETQVYHIVTIDPEGVWENKVSSRRIPRTTL